MDYLAAPYRLKKLSECKRVLRPAYIVIWQEATHLQVSSPLQNLNWAELSWAERSWKLHSIQNQYIYEEIAAASWISTILPTASWKIKLESATLQK